MLTQTNLRRRKGRLRGSWRISLWIWTNQAAAQLSWSQLLNYWAFGTRKPMIYRAGNWKFVRGFPNYDWRTNVYAKVVMGNGMGECRCVFLRNGKGVEKWKISVRPPARCKYWKSKNIFVTYCVLWRTSNNIIWGGDHGTATSNHARNGFAFYSWSSVYEATYCTTYNAPMACGITNGTNLLTDVGMWEYKEYRINIRIE
jgi:hypothetical protein